MGKHVAAILPVSASKFTEINASIILLKNRGKYTHLWCVILPEEPVKHYSISKVKILHW